MSDEARYITTPIYYVNDRPHIGHVYTTTLCDMYARAMRMQKFDVFFLTGTDEHGVKVEQSAIAKGVTPQALADENSAAFRSIMGSFDLTNDDFIRTTEEAHMKQVQRFVEKLLESGDVYLGTFEGWYDEGQEEYHTETNAKELEYKSPVNGKPLVRATEQNYYFKLSKYQSAIEALYQSNPEFVRPESRRNEMLGRLKEGLQDVPISRTNFTWGIGMPGDEAHVIYVWIDALFNYITGLGLGDPESDWYKQRHHYWPAAYHVVGKEILWFHSIIWPAVLMALDIPLPKCIYAHSFWISEGRKMSKSLGNFIDLDKIESYVSNYGSDAWRYYLVTQGPLGATDADFAAEKFHDIYNAHLVNTIGNCTSRVTAMIQKYFNGELPSEFNGDNRYELGGVDWPTRCADAVKMWKGAIDKFELVKATNAPMDLIRDVDLFINDTAPFKLAKDATKQGELGAILYQCLETLRIATLLLKPLLPEKMEEFHHAIGLTDQSRAEMQIPDWSGMCAGTAIAKVALYPRVELSTAT